MYVCITGVKNNQDVYLKQSYRKENGKTSSRIYRMELNCNLSPGYLDIPQRRLPVFTQFLQWK